MPALLVSLGTSQAIVPEAYFLPGVSFDAVHVLTTASVQVDEVVAFFSEQAPGVALSISRVADMPALNSVKDHFVFEEALYRWILDTGTTPESRYICLSGGYKTMSGAVQTAAAILGAAEVFHVLADAFLPTPDGRGRPPSSIREILLARDTGHLHFVRLGAESGWPQFHHLKSETFPLTRCTISCGVSDVRTQDHGFRNHLREILERSHRIASAWDVLTQLPFPELATWSKAELAWLNSPVDAEADAQWIQRLPKVELHTHLGGFATKGADLMAVRAAAQHPSKLPMILDLILPEGWPLPLAACGLDRYMSLGNNSGSRLLRDRGCLIAQCQLLYEALVQDGVAYAEIRCSPNNYASEERGAFQVLDDIRRTFQDCMDRHSQFAFGNRAGSAPCHINLIIIATRKTAGDRSDISRHLALAITAADQWQDSNACRVVGVDLAGFEQVDTRAALFQADFDPVHRVGLAVTVHAGENDDAEGIWQAVFKLNARRIGHALHLAGAPDLVRAVADRSIAIEMCPYANLQIKGYAIPPSSPQYPMLDYLRRGVRVTINTDNRGISDASLSDNLRLAALLCPELTRLDLIKMQRNAIDAAFLTPATRLRLLNQIASSLVPPISI